MAKKNIRLGLIGCGGNMRDAHIPRLRRDGANTIVVVADPVASNAERIASLSKDSPVIESNWKKVLDHDIDAVVISTPHDQHYRQVSTCLENGLDVVIEKPLTPNPREARKLLDLASRKRRKLVVSYQRHWMPVFTYARELIRKKEIGTVRGASVYVTQNWGNAGGWRLDPRQSGGGMFMDTGSHLVASTLWLTGLEPAEVFAFSDDAGRPVDVNTVVSIRCRNGALISIDTIGNTSLHDERIAIHGSRGSIVLDSHGWKAKPLLLNDSRQAIPKRHASDSPDEAFLRYLRGGKGYEKPAFALEVANLSNAVYRSVVRGRPVRVRS